MKFKETPSAKQVALLDSLFDPGASVSRKIWRESGNSDRTNPGPIGLRSASNPGTSKLKPYDQEVSLKRMSGGSLASKQKDLLCAMANGTNSNKPEPVCVKHQDPLQPLPHLKDSYAILDLDHTLINTETTVKPNAVLEANCDFHFKLQGHYYYVFKRPGVDKFIEIKYEKNKSDIFEKITSNTKTVKNEKNKDQTNFNSNKNNGLVMNNLNNIGFHQQNNNHINKISTSKSKK